MDTTSGTKKIEGRRDRVTYTLADESKNPSNAKARNFFAEAGKKFGAKAMSDPKQGFQVALMKKTPHGEFWYEYAHGSGNDESTGSYTLTTVEVLPLKQEVEAKGALTDWNMKNDPCKDPPWLVKQFSYFKIDDCSARDVDQIKIDTDKGEQTFTGHVYSVNYKLTDEKKDPVALAVQKNYVRALEAIGAKLVSRPDDVFKAVLVRETKDGPLIYRYTHGSGNEDSTGSYALEYLQPASKLEKACSVQLYGVNFDFNKAELRDESAPVLNEVLALFKNNPSYAAEIAGHTDDVGEKNYNLKLSSERADAVKAWLVAHGIDAARITTAGYGDTRPLVPNTNDENRAKNRREELRKKGC